MNTRSLKLLLSFIFTLITGSTFTNYINTHYSLSASVNSSAVLGLQSTHSPLYSVTKIIDGDTLKVIYQGKETTVRLVGIDAPETHHPTQPNQCYGPEAATKLAQLIAGQPVYLQYDSIQGQKDRYGRLLAYVYRQDNLFINAEMIKQGFATAYTKLDSEHLDDFKQLELNARQQQLGLWSACNY